MNQCDGCRAGWEVRSGLHYDRHGKVQMVCTANRYPMSCNTIKTLPNGDTEGFSVLITGMVPEQPEALRLADELERWLLVDAPTRVGAAAELRRLSAENEALRESLKTEELISFRRQMQQYAAQVEKDEALLRQALDTLAYWLEHGETPGAHDMIQRTHDVLQERLK